MPRVPTMPVCLMAALLALAASAAAEPTVPVTNPESVVIRFVPVDNSPGGPALDGFATTDIRVDLGSADGYRGSELLIELQRGSFFRDVLGSPVGSEPTRTDLQQSVSLAFDTYFAGGNAVGAGAISLGASPIAVFPVNGGSDLSQAWSGAGQAIVAGVTNYLDARLTVSDDAMGTFEYLLFTSGNTSYRAGVIVNGIFIPEPCAGLLWGIFAVAVLFRNHAI